MLDADLSAQPESDGATKLAVGKFKANGLHRDGIEPGTRSVVLKELETLLVNGVKTILKFY